MKFKKILFSSIIMFSLFFIYSCKKDKPIEKEEEKINVTFVLYDDNKNVEQITKNTKIEKPSDPIRDGYEFDYWYLTVDSKEYLFDENVNEDITLYAKWTNLKEKEALNQINEDIEALEDYIKESPYKLPNKGFVNNSKITWKSDSAYLTSKDFVLPLKKGDDIHDIIITGVFSKSGSYIEKEFTYTISKLKPVILDKERTVDFENLTTEYDVKAGSLDLYYEQDGTVPYVKIEDFLKLLNGFIDPKYLDNDFDNGELTFVTEGNILTIDYDYYDDENDKNYDLTLKIDADNNTISTNDLGFFMAYVYSTETNYGRNIEYVDSVDEYEEGGKDLYVYDLDDYNLDIVVKDDDVVLPYYIANQLFIGSSYYNVYYNYDKLYGIYSIPDEIDLKKITKSSVSGKDLSDDLVLNNYNSLVFFMDYFYGLKNLREINTFYDVIDANKIMDYNSERLDNSIYDFLMKYIDEPHTTYQTYSYYNKNWDGPDMSSLDNYGYNFKIWYYKAYVYVNDEIGNKWGEASNNSWNSVNKPNYLFLDSDKKTVSLTLNEFSTLDIQESNVFDNNIIKNFMDDNNVELPVFNKEGKYFYYNSSNTNNKITEILIKDCDETDLSNYKDLLSNTGFTYVHEETSTLYKSSGYYSKSLNGKDYMVYVNLDETYNVLYIGVADMIPSSYEGTWLLNFDVESLISNDSAVYMEFILDIIKKESPNFENIILDLTWNGGGNVGALYRVLGFITGNTPFKVSSIDEALDYRSTSYVQISNSPDYSDKNWFFLTSPHTFSAANELVTIVKENNLGKILGIKSGGGSASITPILLPNGTFFTMSSTNLNGYRTGSGTEEDPYVYTANEYGINPDYVLEYSQLYDETTLLSYIND